MDFYEVLDQVVALLRTRGRVTYIVFGRSLCQRRRVCTRLGAHRGL
jgi:hypothetical protein